MSNWFADYKYRDEPGHGNSGAVGFCVVEADSAEEAELLARQSLSSDGLEKLVISPDPRTPPVAATFARPSHK